MELSGHGGSKLLLFGEHAAVYGYPAVGVALPDGVSVRIKPDGTDWRFLGIPAGYADIMHGLMGHAEGVLENRFGAAPVRALRGDMRIEATVPPALGFGSSAAICTAVAAALLPQLRAEREPAVPAEIWHLAHELEVFFHGSPSGIDTGLSHLGGIQAFSFEGGKLPRARSLRNPDLFLLVGAVPRSADTRALVGRIRAEREAGSKAVGDALERLGAIAEEAIDLLGRPAGQEIIARIGALANAAQEHLRDLELSNDDLEAVLAAAADAGGAGGKLSGAGGGGAFYIIFDEAAALLRAETAVRRVLDEIALGLPLFSYRVVAGDAERITTAA